VVRSVRKLFNCGVYYHFLLALPILTAASSGGADPTANKTENLAFFRDFVNALGFSRITGTDWASHDRKIAFTSQLCHLIASALVESAEDTGITAFGGGSFEDLTRIAMINAPLWTELFLANREALLRSTDAFKLSLERVTEFIKNADSAGLCGFLEAVRAKRTAMTGEPDET
jgi:prephenate dehydrogenase